MVTLAYWVLNGYVHLVFLIFRWDGTPAQFLIPAPLAYIYMDLATRSQGALA